MLNSDFKLKLQIIDLNDTVNAWIMGHPFFSCICFIHKQSTCIQKGWPIIQAFTVIVIFFSSSSLTRCNIIQELKLNNCKYLNATLSKNVNSLYLKSWSFLLWPTARLFSVLVNKLFWHAMKLSDHFRYRSLSF